MNFENAFLGPRSIQVCHLRSKTPLTSVDCLRRPPRRIQRGHKSPRVPCRPAELLAAAPASFPAPLRRTLAPPSSPLSPRDVRCAPVRCRPAWPPPGFARASPAPCARRSPAAGPRRLAPLSLLHAAPRPPLPGLLLARLLARAARRPGPAPCASHAHAVRCSPARAATSSFPDAGHHRFVLSGEPFIDSSHPRLLLPPLYLFEPSPGPWPRHAELLALKLRPPPPSSVWPPPRRRYPSCARPGRLAAPPHGAMRAPSLPPLASLAASPLTGGRSRRQQWRTAPHAAW